MVGFSGAGALLASEGKPLFSPATKGAASQIYGFLVPEIELAEGESIAFSGIPLVRIRSKPINLPAWDKVTVHMSHIAERHIVGGELTGGRTVFPSTMNTKGVLSAVRAAYKGSTKIGVQGNDRILLLGEGNGLKIEMWFNKATNTIETAYPVTR